MFYFWEGLNKYHSITTNPIIIHTYRKQNCDSMYYDRNAAYYKYFKKIYKYKFNIIDRGNNNPVQQRNCNLYVLLSVRHLSRIFFFS